MLPTHYTHRQQAAATTNPRRVTSSPGKGLPEFHGDSMGPQRIELAMGSKDDKVWLKNKKVDLLS